MRPSLWCTERDRQIWVARTNGASFTDIGAHFGISTSRAWEVDRNVQGRINARMAILQFGTRWPR
jgi:hypothetical protein